MSDSPANPDRQEELLSASLLKGGDEGAWRYLLETIEPRLVRQYLKLGIPRHSHGEMLSLTYSNLYCGRHNIDDTRGDILGFAFKSGLNAAMTYLAREQRRIDQPDGGPNSSVEYYSAPENQPGRAGRLEHAISRLDERCKQLIDTYKLKTHGEKITEALIASLGFASFPRFYEARRRCKAVLAKMLDPNN